MKNVGKNKKCYFAEQSSFVPSEEGLATVMSMGFTKDQASKALEATNNVVERAVNWIFSHASELDGSATEEVPGTRETFRNGSSSKFFRLKNILELKRKKTSTLQVS